MFDKGGCKAALEARKAGKVRFIGFTGHKHPAIHRAMLDKPFDWDTCQMPINVMDASYRSFQKEVVPLCLAKNVGVIGMKGLGGSGAAIVTKGGVAAVDAYRYALSQPVAAQVVGIQSLENLAQNVALARGFKPMTGAEQAALVLRAKEAAADGRYEISKSTQLFDGPHHLRQHVSRSEGRRRYQPTFFPWFCSSSHFCSGAKYSSRAEASMRRSPVRAKSASGHGRLWPMASIFSSFAPAAWLP